MSQQHEEVLGEAFQEGNSTTKAGGITEPRSMPDNKETFQFLRHALFKKPSLILELKII